MTASLPAASLPERPPLLIVDGDQLLSGFLSFALGTTFAAITSPSRPHRSTFGKRMEDPAGEQ